MIIIHTVVYTEKDGKITVPLIGMIDTGSGDMKALCTEAENIVTGIFERVPEQPMPDINLGHRIYDKLIETILDMKIGNETNVEIYDLFPEAVKLPEGQRCVAYLCIPPPPEGMIKEEFAGKTLRELEFENHDD